MVLPQMLAFLLTDSEEGIDPEWLGKVRNARQPCDLVTKLSAKSTMLHVCLILHDQSCP